MVLDLKRMNRILEVSETNAYALVEPGVSYFDLYSYIQEHKLKVWIDPPDPGWGSPIGNALDHGGDGIRANAVNADRIRTGLMTDTIIAERAKARGKHRKKRERKPLPGMMVHQDASTHEWVPEQIWDLVVTLDDATS